MVMPLYEGITLKDKLRNMAQPARRRLADGRCWHSLTEALAGHPCRAAAFTATSRRTTCILLAGSERPLLLDFGAARQRHRRHATQALTVILKPGFAPVEQYAEVPSK